MPLNEDKRVAQAQDKAAGKNNLLMYLVVINRVTGKAEITEFQTTNSLSTVKNQKSDFRSQKAVSKPVKIVGDCTKELTEQHVPVSKPVKSL